MWWGRTDSLRCGEATAVASVHWTLAKSRLSNPSRYSFPECKKSSSFELDFWWGRTDSPGCGRATAGQTVHRTVCLDRPFESIILLPVCTKRPILLDWSFCGGGGRIRFAAAKPRRLQVSTGHLPRAAFQIRPAILFLNAKSPVLSNWTFGGGGRIRTIEAKRSRFTVCPLWPLGNSPIFTFGLEPVDGLEPPTY